MDLGARMALLGGPEKPFPRPDAILGNVAKSPYYLVFDGTPMVSGGGHHASTAMYVGPSSEQGPAQLVLGLGMASFGGLEERLERRYEIPGRPFPVGMPDSHRVVGPGRARGDHQVRNKHEAGDRRQSRRYDSDPEGSSAGPCPDLRGEAFLSDRFVADLRSSHSWVSSLPPYALLPNSSSRSAMLAPRFSLPWPAVSSGDWPAGSTQGRPGSPREMDACPLSGCSGAWRAREDASETAGASFRRLPFRGIPAFRRCERFGSGGRIGLEGGERVERDADGRHARGTGAGHRRRKGSSCRSWRMEPSGRNRRQQVPGSPDPPGSLSALQGRHDHPVRFRACRPVSSIGPMRDVGKAPVRSRGRLLPRGAPQRKNRPGGDGVREGRGTQVSSGRGDAQVRPLARFGGGARRGPSSRDKR